MLAILLFFTACDTVDGDDTGKKKEKNKVEDHVELPKDTIILDIRSANWAWGYADSGVFVDTDGGVYRYDFSTPVHPGHYEDHMNKLYDIREYTDPDFTLDGKVIEKLYSYITQIDPEAECEEKHAACDAGCRTTTVYRNRKDSGMQLEITGDFEGYNKDKYAKKALTCIETSIVPKIAVSYNGEDPEFQDSRVVYYTDKELHIYSYHSGYNGYEGMLIIRNEEDAAKLKEYTGVDVMNMTWDWEPFYNDRIYVVQFTDVPSGGYDLIMKGIMQKGEKLFLIESEDSTRPQGTAAAVMDGFVFVAEYPLCCGTDKLPENDWSFLER